MSGLWRFVVDIFEPATRYPVLRHVFYGEDEEEAYGYFESHMMTDAFLAGCVKAGLWNGIKCHASAHWLAPGEQIDDP